MQSWQEEIARGYELYRQGEHREVLKLFARLRLEYPEVAQVWHESAGMHDRMGFEEDAAPLYERALALGLAGEELVDCLICLGSTYRNLGQLEDSLRRLEDARRLQPDNLAIQAFLSLTLADLGHGADAVRLLGQALLRESDDGKLQGYNRALKEYFATVGRV
ncbi:tetratricopeptide repeat protein [Tumebacillus sp. BK434]|uniref:tetratricopeptide repeat protein n=1 Tax=Tumebacillus sp. BK434 TaxID=2512169 RepID=UPI0010D0FDC5|nr:tetratricopeptide repeat protein [Tumebacillus sp. BK434]TCP52668.1 tetratricopeptide repeat protein [Tumebacillus sp. BK434]